MILTTNFLSAPVLSTTAELKGVDTIPVSGGTALTAPVNKPLSAPVLSLVHQLTPQFEELKKQIGKRTQEPQLIEDFIMQLCELRDYKLQEIADILDRQPKYILKEFIQPMLRQEKIEYKKPDMPNHPNQSYRTKKE
jgi:ATP-dependent DNA helicase RecG